MNKFSWYEAASVKDALNQVTSTVSEELYESSNNAALLKSGGVDILDLMKEGLVNPQRIVNIKNIPGLGNIILDKNLGLRIGANATLAQIEKNDNIKKHFHAFHKAVQHAATPQLRNMASLGGNLAQRTRCWYFRSADHPCFRKGGDRCYARSSRTGENENHAIFDNGSCVSVHASSISTALMAYDARVVILNSENIRREVPIEDFFVTPAQDISKESILEANEMITEVILPIPSDNTKSAYLKQGVRESYDWSIGDVAVVARVSGNQCISAKIVLGSAAPVPYRSFAAETMLKDKTINVKNAEAAAIKAMEMAKPLTQNNYKVPLFQALIKKAILELV